MPLIQHVWPWDSLPQEAAQPSEYWLSRGLKSLYILDAGRWQINQVTGQIGGTVAGSGPTFPDGWLRTPGTASNGALLAHGLSTDIALPITLVVGWRRISGSVSWSLLDDVSAWTGWYGAATGEIAASNNNSFNGALTLGGDGGVAFCHISAAELIGASRTSTAIDTSTTVPSAVSPSTVALGWARRSVSGNDNPAVAEFTHFAAIQGALDRADLALLAHRPWELFEPRRVPVPVSAGGGGATDLTVADASHAHAADNLTLSIGVSLTIADALHAHTADSLALSTAAFLAVNDATHAHSADNLTLSTADAVSLTVADAAHAHTADALALTTDSTLAVADALHAHAADNVVLGVSGVADLVIADATHAHTVDGLVLTADSLLAIQDALHAHAADSLTLDTAPTLLIANALHAHTSDGLSLTVDAWLVIADALHGHTADSLTLDDGGAVLLTIADALHAHTADSLRLFYEVWAATRAPIGARLSAGQRALRLSATARTPRTSTRTR